VSGALQWLVMREENTASALWLPASVIGWGSAFAAAWSVASLIGSSMDLNVTYAVIGIILGCLGGGVTGIVLVWLMQRPPAGAPKTAATLNPNS
jgi:Na+/glutamate symporter